MPGTNPSKDATPPVYFLHVKTTAILRNAAIAAAEDNGVSVQDVINDLIKNGLKKYVDQVTPPAIGDFGNPPVDPDVDPDSE